MDRLRYEFNDKIRFPKGSVNKTIFSTTGYKRVTCFGNGFKKEAIAKLNIPAGSTIVRSNLSVGELRTDQVYVEKIKDLDGEIINEDDYQCTGYIYYGVKYKTGEITKPYESLDTNVNRLCVPGIHFYLTKKESENC
nr:hypothetical protein [Megavirus caiporensis]